MGKKENFKMTGNDVFKIDGNFIYLTAPYCEFYIPQSFFKSSGNFAEDRGEIIRGIGLFNVGIFSDGKLVEMKTLNIPTWIEMYVHESENRDVQLPGSNEPEPCRVLIYYQGSKVMNSKIIEDSSNAESYLSLICGGKVPTSVPYSKSAQVWRKNQQMNGVNLGVPAVIEEMILSVSYRNKDNLGQKFCKVVGQNKEVSDYGYEMASIRQICQYASTFTALWFEDFDSMVTTSLNRTRENKPEANSPLEKIIKM
jgi:hypothetical protein